MRMKNEQNGQVLEIEQWYITKNGWEYYVIKDSENTDTIKLCLVLGFETEMGSVYIPEIKPYLLNSTKKLNEIAPAPGWQWVA